MDFRISGLPVAPFLPLFGLSDQQLAACGVARQIADKRPGFPCRVSLQDANLGESVLLLNYEHLPVTSPYRSRHAIFVREDAIESQPGVNEVPELLRSRLLSVRAFDRHGMMIDADVVEGSKLEQIASRFLENPQTGYLHLHNAKPGCFAARVDRS